MHEMDPIMLENQVKRSLLYVAPPHLLLSGEEALQFSGIRA